MKSSTMKTILKALHILLLVTVSVASQAAVKSTTYILTDHLGSPILATDENGDTLWQEDYRPYGIQLTNEDGDNSVSFTGHKDDKALGVTYMQGRWYHQEIGRFLAIDPVRFVENNPISFNRYAYANNNPYTFIDPDGRTPEHMMITNYSVYQEIRGAELGVDPLTREGALHIADVDQKEAAFELLGIAVAKVVGKLLGSAAVTKSGSKGPDFIVSRNGTATHASQSELKKSLQGAGAQSKGSTSQTSEVGEIFEMNTANGPMDIRIMPGKPGGGANSGPRTITTRPGTNDYVHPNGQRITGNASKADRRAIGHTHGQRP